MIQLLKAQANIYGGNICTRVSNMYLPVLLNMRNINGNTIEPFTNNTARYILYLNDDIVINN